MVPKGKVVTYGQVALLLGLPRAARAVGWAMALTPGYLKVPCQRVIYGHGGLAQSYGREGLKEHKRDLEADGVRVLKDYKVDLKKYRWRPDGETLKRLDLPPEALNQLVRAMPPGSGASYRPAGAKANLKSQKFKCEG